MKCPFCQTDNDKVIDSRSSEDGFVIRRRRQCNKCLRRYTTYERIAELDIKVVKKNGVREPFQTDKIRTGLRRACWKRPVADEQIESTVLQIQQEVYKNYEREIESEELGKIVIENLANLDEIAYIRFASVYRSFSDLRDFLNEVEPMIKGDGRFKPK
jgi:transcriptional repressor NrdR